METSQILKFKMTSKNASRNAEKPEVSGIPGGLKTCVDLIKEDGIRKELYQNEQKAKEKWFTKWGFFKSPKKLWIKEAEERSVTVNADVFENNSNSFKNSDYIQEFRNLKIKLLPSKGVPKLSSEIIGWRTFSKENNLNLLVGPTYISQKQTVNLPLNPEEPDLRHQKVIFLG